MKKIFSIAAVAALVLSFASCGPDEPTLNPELKLEREVTLYEGQEYQLVPSFVDIDSLNAELYWESSDKEVVTVDQKGNVVAVKKGDAKITVYIDALQLKASCNVTVKTDEFYVSIDKSTLKVSEKANFSAKMRSGKAVKGEVVYAIYKDGATEAMNDSVCRDSCTFYAYFPGKYKLIASAGSEKAECEFEVVVDLPELKANMSEEDAARLVGSWKEVACTQHYYTYIDGVVKDSTGTLDKLTQYGISFLNDSLAVSLDASFAAAKDTAMWKVENGLLKTGVLFSDGGSTIGMAMVFLAISGVKIQNICLCGCDFASSDDFISETTGKKYNPAMYVASYSFDAKYETLTLKTYSYLGAYAFEPAKGETPAHYSHEFLMIDETITLQKVK